MASKIILIALLFSSTFAFANMEEFQVPDIQKNKVELQTPHVVVYFWATWCPDCKEGLKSKLPALADKDVSIITVNTDAGTDKVLDYLQTEKVNFPTFIDKDKVYRKKYAVYSVPTALIFNKSKDGYVLADTIIGADLERLKKGLSRE